MFNRRGTLASLTGGLLTSLLAGAPAADPKPAQPAKAPMDPTEVLPLWPGDAPGSAGVTAVETLIDRTVAGGLRDRATTHTRKPTLTVFRPGKANGAAVVLMPGGGYERVVSDKEGFETARWLADRGYTCFVLLYRLPGDGWGAGPDAPLQDAQRAVRLARSKAAAMKFDPARVSIMGFSAGGHLAASLTTRFDAKVYDRVDAADDLSARPDLSCPDLSGGVDGGRPGPRRLAQATAGPVADARADRALFARPERHRPRPAGVPAARRRRQDRAGGQQPDDVHGPEGQGDSRPRCTSSRRAATALACAASSASRSPPGRACSRPSPSGTECKTIRSSRRLAGDERKF
jgi:hypothetical protein